MKILVVDDSQLNLAIAKRYLEEIPNISEVYLCSNPEDTKAMINEFHIDIVILDIIMPVITGLDLLMLLREDDQYDDIPIIMLTSIDDIQIYQKCFELGAFDYINKPINGIEFKARLKVAIESKINYNHLKSLMEVTIHQNEELKIANAKLTEAKFSLVQSEKMAAIGQLAAGIAHEINNPMGYVKGNFELLQKYFTKLSEFLHDLKDSVIDTALDESRDTSKIKSDELNDLSYLSQDNTPPLIKIKEKYQTCKIDMILRELDDILIDSENGILRIMEIVGSLKIFARSVKDDEKDTYALHDIIKQVLLISRNEIRYVANVKVHVPDDIVIYCNKVQVGQVIVNMLVNAAQAIKSQKRNKMGVITITAKQLKEDIYITIEDDGPGISEDHLLKIFEPFFTTKEIGQGTGLGLSISYDIIINKHNGAIDVKSEVNKGTIFTIRLPMVTTL
ncbi:MAG: ATP-binding protein [Herbinix sp.]|jgi:signal transduction histidine kinase|nr:ATP-binding protein [Herbinix sp.]